QARVLHRYHRLSGEVFEKSDLLFAERPPLLTPGCDATEDDTVLLQRHEQDGAEPCHLDSDTQSLVIRLARGAFRKVVLGHGIKGQRVANSLTQNRRVRFGYAACRGNAEQIAVKKLKTAAWSIAETMRFLQYRVEHRREIAGRGIDDPQDLGGRGLLLQGLACLIDEPRVLHSNDRLGREVLQQFDISH